MRILIFTQQLAAFRSGVGTYSYGLITGLMALGHQVTAVVPESEKVEMPALRTITVPRLRFDLTPGGWLSLGISFAKILYDEQGRYDIAHFTDAREAWCVCHSSIPVTAMVNDSYAIDWIKPNYLRRLFSDRYLRSLYYTLLRAAEKQIYSRLDVVITNSSYTAGMITEGYRLDPGKVHVIYCGLSEQPSVSLISLAGLPSVLFVGGNFQRKGLSVLLKAVARLLSRFPHIRLHVVGKDRNQPYLVAQACKLGIDEAVEFHGWQPNDRVRGMMTGANVFVLPSLTEGFGLVYLEAMRAGVPVIATSMGGAKEVFIEDKEALFVEPGDINGLTSALEKIASDPETVFRLREGGRAAVKRFTVDAMAKATEELLFKILKRKL